MYLLKLDRDFLVIDEDLWNRVSTFDAVSRSILSEITAKELSEEVLEFLLEYELFQVSEEITDRIDSVNEEIASRLNSVFGKLTAFVSARINKAQIDGLLREYNRLAQEFARIAHEALQLKRDQELQAELERVGVEMDSIFDQIATLIKESYQTLGITISNEHITSMVGGSKDDLIEKYTGGLK